MVAVEDQHRPLLPLLQGRCQLAHKGVHLVDLVHVVLHGVVIVLIGAGLHRDGRVLQHRIGGIFAVALDGDGEHQIRLSLRRIQRLQDLVGEHGVLGPVLRRQLCPGHVLQSGEVVKAQVGVHLVPAVESRPVVVDGVGRIAVGLQVVGHGFRRLLRQLGLIGVLPGAEKAGVHAGEDLKLRVGGPRPHHRHGQIAGGAALPQGRPVGHRVLRQLQSPDEAGIDVGLQLHEDHVHVCQGLCAQPGRVFLHRPDDALHRRLAVAGGPADAPVQPRLQKAVGKAVVLIGEGQIGKLVGEISHRESQGAAAPHQQTGHRHGGGAGQQPGPQRSAAAGPLPEQQRQPRRHQDQGGDQQHDVPGGEIVGHRVQPGLEHRQIRHGEGRHAVEEDEAVHPAAHQPHKGHQGAPEGPPPQEEAGRQRHQHDQHIGQKRQRLLRHEAPEALRSLREGLVVEQLRHDRDQQGQQRDIQERPAFLRMPRGIRRRTMRLHHGDHPLSVIRALL